MSYERRRYRMVNGKMEKAFHGLDTDGWARTKAEAWANAGMPISEPVGDPDDSAAASDDLVDDSKPRRRGRKPLPRDGSGNIVREELE
jgi:hypothetical protein